MVLLSSRLPSRDIIYGMNEMIQELVQEKKKVFRLFFQEYGKVSAVFVILSVCLVSLLVLLSFASPKKLRVSFLDIGQGDAILIQTPSGKQMLVEDRKSVV